jgi:hypothetical protein
MWAKFSPAAKRAFKVLMDEPGRHVSAEELAAKAGLRDTFTVAGTFAWPGRYCAAAGRKFPIAWSRENGSEYWIEPEIAQLFGQAEEDAR